MRVSVKEGSFVCVLVLKKETLCECVKEGSFVCVLKKEDVCVLKEALCVC